MRNRTLALVLLSLLSVAVPAGARLPDSVPLAVLPRLAAPPVIDGSLQEWTSRPAQFTDFQDYIKRIPPAAGTTAWTGWDSQNLYFAFHCDEPRMQDIRRKVADPDGAVWQDDCVEALLDPGGRLGRFYHFIVSSAGVVYDADTGNTLWQSGAKVATARDKDSWSLEMAIPLASLGVPATEGSEWGLNVCRERHVDIKDEVSSWAYPFGSFENPARFGRIVLGGEKPPFVGLSSPVRPFFGHNSVQLSLLNPGPAAFRARVQVLAGTDESLAEVATVAAEAAAGSSQTAKAVWDLTGGGETVCVLKVTNADTGALLQRILLPVVSLPPAQVGELRQQLGALEMLGQRPLPPAVKSDLKTLGDTGATAIASFGSLVQKAISENRTLTQQEWEGFVGQTSGALDKIRVVSSVVRQADPWTDLQPRDVPAKIADSPSFELVTCQGAHDPIAINITNLSGGKLHTRLMFFELSGKGGQYIPAERITLREALFHRLKDERLVADPLPLARQAGDVEVPVCETRQMWVQVDTRNVAPGDYTGQVQFVPFDPSLPNKTIPIHVRVLPVRFAAGMPIPTYNWDYATAPGDIRDLYEHRVNHLLIGSSCFLPVCDRSGRVLRVDYTEHDREVLKKRAFGAKIIYSYGLVESFDTGVAKKMGWKYLSAPWKRAFKTWVRGWVAHLKSMGLGYDDYCVQIWDEAIWDEVPKVVAVGPFLREVDPKIRWMMDGDQNLAQAKAMNPYVDIWVPYMEGFPRRTAADTRALLAFYKSTGKPVWGYTCRTAMPKQPVVRYYRLKPWAAWKYGMQGVAFWAYNSWRGNPWSDEQMDSGGYSDNGVIYRGITGPVPSRRWEAYRAGLEDYITINQLSKAADRAALVGLKADSAAAHKLIRQAVADCFQHPYDGPRTDSWRSKMLASLMTLSAKLWTASPQKPVVSCSGSGADVTWRAEGGVSGEVCWRLPGELSWRVAQARRNGAEFKAHLAGLQPGVRYELFTSTTGTYGLVKTCGADKPVSFRAGSAR